MSGNLVAMILVGHMVGDWLLQTDWSGLNKMHSWPAMWLHVLTYHIVMAVSTFAVWPQLRWTWLVWMGISIFSHAMIDRRWFVKWLRDQLHSPGFQQTPLGAISGDQAVHLAILYVAGIALT